jgi:hypothetical protein
MDANKYDFLYREILLLLLIPHMHPFIPELWHIFHEWFQEHININANLLRTLDTNRQHEIPSFVTQPCQNILQCKDDRPCVVHSHVFTKWIHSIGTQSKPYISTLCSKLWILKIKIFTKFHLQGVESPHHFPYASQNTSAPVPHP